MQCAAPTWRSAANVKQTVATWDFYHNCHNLVITSGKCWSCVVKNPNVVSLEARQPMTLGNCNSSVALNHKAALSHEAMMLLEMTTFDWRFNQPIFCKLCNAKNQKSWPSSESCLYITQNRSNKNTLRYTVLCPHPKHQKKHLLEKCPESLQSFRTVP